MTRLSIRASLLLRKEYFEVSLLIADPSTGQTFNNVFSPTKTPKSQVVGLVDRQADGQPNSAN